MANNYTLSTQEKIFTEELDGIQKRHKLFFPIEQKRYISIVTNAGNSRLELSPDLDLPEVIMLEIEMAFKLAYGD